MKRLTLSACLAVALQASAATHPLTPAPLVNPTVTVNVDAAAGRHAIDPRIYGVAWGDPTTMSDLGVTINRWGGNAMSRYNWIYSTANRCKDWYFENVPDDVSSGDGSDGKSADDFIGHTFDAGAQPIITIPMMGLLPKDRAYRCGFSVALYGAQDDVDPWRTDCGNGRVGGNRLFGNHPTDTSATYTSAHQADWIQHLVGTWGTAANGGVRYYALDNEPVLWSFDHWDVHPAGSTYTEIRDAWFDYGAAIKAADPTALTTGPEEWGWSGYFDSGIDAENGNDQDRHDNGGDVPLAEWLLQQARAYEQAHGTRILDVATVHFYPQGGEFSNDKTTATKLRRNRSTRSLWDPSYVDESWIGGTGIDGGHVRLIPRLKEWVANDYPGTQIGITEYNWGAEGDWQDSAGDINGGTAQADILGIFGREGLDVGVRWTAPPNGTYVYNAFKMYRNYDGAHHGFGDLSVSGSSPDPDNLATFAALRSSDGALTVVVVAKTLSGSTPVTLSLANYLPSGAAQRWQLDSANAITHLADVALSGSTLALTVPSPSVTLLVIPGSYLDAPAKPAATSSVDATKVTVSWPAVAGATGYDVWRSSNHGAFAAAGSTAGTTTFDDTTVAGDTTYLYEVRAKSGTASSPFGPFDYATTTAFTGGASLVGATVEGAHLAQLRVAVNAMRAAAGLGAQAFTDDPLPALALVKAQYLTELRDALAPALTALGVPAWSYTDGSVTAGEPIQASHVTDIRNAVK